ncbi:unnamed protein product [Clonostachys solani]|uniref:Aldehyde dehydrogenase domain-containing protein n=1 Tax=Clonostachys solani TaxID=160281 RepID=A0A9P0EJG9_9HYPO|nr:unnamed protein product [Clonostachys solani]
MGSTNTIREIMKLAATNRKDITSKPGAIFEYAELENAAKWAHYGTMANQGQICTATSRVLVQDKIYKQFIDLFVYQVKNFSKIGHPLAQGTFQGPQISRAQYDRVLSYFEEGATVGFGGKPHLGVNGKGFFIEPTVFTSVKDHMKLSGEKVFGPLVAISSFSAEDEAKYRR